MTKPRIKLKLRLVPKSLRPLAKLSAAEKLANAKAYLQSRGRYILDRGTPKPSWGIAYTVPAESQLMKEVMEADRRRK